MSEAPALLAWAQTAQTLAAFAMTGVIWMVQLVQYPGFSRVGVPEFAAFHLHHARSIGLVVGPLMVLELLTALLLAAVGEPAWFWRSMLAVLLVIWFSTALWQGPLHGRLAREGPRRDLLRALVRGNWLRTFLWTARSTALLCFYARGWAWS